MIKAFITNAQHPEFGGATVPLPIPSDEYEGILDLLKAMEISDAVQQDCHVVELTDGFPVLKRLEGARVNLDELDYLAKRLDSFDAGETAQSQRMAEKLNLYEIIDFINLTFCCQRAPVITDFSNLEAVGRAHYMNLHDGYETMEKTGGVGWI